MDKRPPYIEAAAKALWEMESHPLLEHAGYPTDWESQSKRVKAGICAKVHVVERAIRKAKEDQGE